MDGGAVNHQLGIAQMGGVMLQIYCHAHGALGLGDLGFFHIAAGNGQPAMRIKFPLDFAVRDRAAGDRITGRKRRNAQR